jgi:hypothetical protein
MYNFALLGSLAHDLQQQFISLYYVFLPVFFALAIAIAWFKDPTGSPDFLDILKRAIIATVLVSAFDEISSTILAVTSGVADKISDMSGLDTFMKMAGEKCQSYTLSTTSLILGFNDMLIAIISFCSYAVLYVARYVSVALYHFMWLFLSILAPILILFSLFRGTQSVTINLFRGLIEVACWKIVWAVLSAMITSLSFGNAYAADGNYLTVVLLNFVIAMAMLGTPMIVKSLVGNGLSSMAESLGAAATVAMIAAPTRVQGALQIGRQVLSNTHDWASHTGNRMSSHLPGLKSVSGEQSPPPSAAPPASPPPPLARPNSYQPPAP